MLAKIGLILFTLLYALKLFTPVSDVILEIGAGIACVGLILDSYFAFSRRGA